MTLSNINSLPQAHTTLHEMLVDLLGDPAEIAVSAEMEASYEQTTLACLKFIMVNETNFQKSIAAIRIASTILGKLQAFKQ